jgi:hypothetical protein
LRDALGDATGDALRSPSGDSSEDPSSQWFYGSWRKIVYFPTLLTFIIVWLHKYGNVHCCVDGYIRLHQEWWTVKHITFYGICIINNILKLTFLKHLYWHIFNGILNSWKVMLFEFSILSYFVYSFLFSILVSVDFWWISYLAYRNLVWTKDFMVMMNYFILQFDDARAQPTNRCRLERRTKR